MNELCLEKSYHTLKKFILIFINVLLLSSLLLSHNAWAALNLELTQGVANQLPIAIVPFASEVRFAPENDVPQVIQSDLSHSGQFKVTLAKNLAQADKAGVVYWRAHGHFCVVLIGTAVRND